MKKKGEIAVFTSGRSARDSSKIEAIPAVATLRTAERTDTVPLVASRAIAVQIARGTFIHFTLIAKYGAPEWRMCERDREKKTEITRRSEFARELKADGQVSTHLFALCAFFDSRWPDLMAIAAANVKSRLKVT